MASAKAGVSLPRWGAELRHRFETWFAGPRASDPFGYSATQPLRSRDAPARSAVSYGLQVLQGQTAVFSRGLVLEEAYKVMPLGSGVERLERELDRLLADGRVRHADLGRYQGLTTAYSLALEAEVVAHMEAGRGRAMQRLSPSAAEAGLGRWPGGDQLNAGQRAAARLVLSSPDAVVAIQGVAGAGKTTMFGAIAGVLRQEGIGLIGLTPTHSARRELADKTGMETFTVARFLGRYGALAETGGGVAAVDSHRGKVLVADEASMIANETAARLLRVAKALGIAKVVFVGDERQHGAVGAGAPFRYLQRQGAPMARLDQVIRQKDADLRQAVEHFSQGASAQAILALGDGVVETGAGSGPSDLIERAMQIWRSAKDDGVERPIISATQSDRTAVNALVLLDLEQRGEIQSLGSAVARLVSRHMQGPEVRHASNYGLGDVLVFHAALRAQGIKPGEHWTVAGKEQSAKVSLLHLTAEDGRKASIDLRGLRRGDRTPFAVYEPTGPVELKANAVYVWERTDQARELNIGQPFRIVGERNGQIEVQAGDGRTLRLALSDPQLKFIGPGYAMTSNRSQAMSLELDPIGILPSWHANQARAYVAASRGIHGFTLVTDDRNRLVQRLVGDDGINLIASENLRGGAFSLGLLPRSRPLLEKSIVHDKPLPEASL